MEVRENAEDMTPSTATAGGFPKRKTSMDSNFSIDEMVIDKENPRKHYDSENSDFGIISLWKIDEFGEMVCLKSIPIENPIAIYVHKRSTSKNQKDEQLTYKALF